MAFPAILDKAVGKHLSERSDQVPVLGVFSFVLQVHGEEGVTPARILVEKMRGHSTVPVPLVDYRHYIAETPYLHLEQALHKKPTPGIVAHLDKPRRKGVVHLRGRYNLGRRIAPQALKLHRLLWTDWLYFPLCRYFPFEKRLIGMKKTTGKVVYTCKRR